MALRADGGIGISIYTQDTTGKGIEITAQTGGKAIESYGNHTITSRSGELINLVGHVVVGGLGVSVLRTLSTTTYLTLSDCYFNYINSTSNGTVYLPPDPTTDKVIYVMRQYSVTLTVQGNGEYILISTGTAVTSYATADVRVLYKFVYDGAYWQMHIINR